jgi:RimJ/RimL family protein N-acetyltransferase
VTAARHVEPLVLEGRIVRLEPMTLDHVDGLTAVAEDPALWRWTTGRPMDRAAMLEWVERALANRDSGTEHPWVTVDRATGRPIGSSRYLNIVLEHRRLEIGWTWVTTAWQRRGANREAKLLMIEHAFERLGCMRVEFKTDALNAQSRSALAGIGATFEGVFRRHMVMPDGRIRDSAYFSIIEEEWPAVKARLEASVVAAAGRAAEDRGG